MEKVNSDLEYLEIVDDIINNKSFMEIKECKHHGISRLDHSFRVSYYSYKITKKLHLNYIETARGGLLHDFFISNEERKKNEKLKSVFTHPYKALNNSNNYFSLTELESDIIINHMFPTLPHKVPKYIESWIVSGVDKIIAIYEFYYSYSKNFVYKFSKLYILLLLFRF